MGAHFSKNQGFEQTASFLVANRVREALGESARNAAVEQIELAVTHLLVRRLQFPRRQPKANQGVHQQVEVVLHGGSRHARVARDSADIGRLAILSCRHL